VTQVKQFTPTFRQFSSDQTIWREVYSRNDYQVPAFSLSDLAIDVGAHIGAFSCVCLARGAHRLIAFEPDPANFGLAKQNIQSYLNGFGAVESLTLHNAAIWRSDREESLRITNVRFNSLINSFHQAAQCTLFQDQDTVAVNSVGLDSVLNHHSKVTLLKMDCEGAEWPIIFTSTQLHKVMKLVLEVHSLAWKAAESDREIPAHLFAEFGHYTLGDLKAKMKRFGLMCVREQINRDYLNNPDFYFGQVLFENREL
jgi:FkbM family methyltransferase